MYLITLHHVHLSMANTIDFFGRINEHCYKLLPKSVCESLCMIDVYFHQISSLLATKCHYLDGENSECIVLCLPDTLLTES